MEVVTIWLHLYL